MASSSVDEALGEDKPPPPTKYQPYSATSLLAALNIVHGSIWGVLARRGLTALTTYNGAYVGGVVWANFASCVVMGMLVHSTHVWKHATKKSGLYLGLSTGFCGTCSSFSSLVLDAFYKATDTQEHVHYHYPNGAYGIMEFFSVVLTQLALSTLALSMGGHLLQLLDHRTPSISPASSRRTAVASSAVGIALVIITIVLICTQNYGTWRSWMFSCLFAPLGALTRFYLLPLNSKNKRFPVGTFIANVAGTVLIAVLVLLTRAKKPHAASALVLHATGCHVLQGLIDGYCGGLTTISTFVAELFALETSAKYVYAGATVIAGFVPLLLILGAYNWTHGLGAAVCS